MREKIDRMAIKKEAWQLTKNNFLNIYKGMIFSVIIQAIYYVVFSYVFTDRQSSMYLGLSSVYNIVTIPISFGVTRYLLNLIRNKEHSIKDIFYYYRYHILECVIISIITSLAMSFGLIAFVFPAIYFYLIFAMSENIFVDGTTNIINNIKESFKLIKGYKWDYLNFLIGFVGWLILSVLSFGIVFIWVYPYMTIAQKIYYERLIELKK